MAPEVNVPPDKVDKFYKCHPKTQVKTLICIICENSYHKSDLGRETGFKYVGNLLIVCPDHADENITSKIADENLSESARFLIAQIKLKSTEDVKLELLSDLANKTADLNTSVIDQDTETLKTEIALLRSLNEEMRDKNNLLKELLSVHKQKQNNTPQLSLQKTYSQATIITKPPPKQLPKLVMKKKNNTDVIDITKVKMHLAREKNIQTRNIKINKQNEVVTSVVINCMNEDSLNVATNILKDKLSDKCLVEKEELEKPKVRIVGIIDDLETEYNMQTLEEDLNERNFKNLEEKCKVLHISDSKENKKERSAIVEVTRELYTHIVNNKKRVFVGSQNCKVFDVINVKPCYNCCRFGHNGSKCNNESACLKCAGNHETVKCKSLNVACANCIFHNEKYNTKHETDHTATDSAACQVLQNKIKKVLEKIDYPVLPSLPRFLGKVENLKEDTRRRVKKTNLTPATTDGHKPKAKS